MIEVFFFELLGHAPCAAGPPRRCPRSCAHACLRGLLLRTALKNCYLCTRTFLTSLHFLVETICCAKKNLSF
jgi:hypothetical protein